MGDQPIIVDVSNKCDDFKNMIKAAKKAQGKTNQDISDATGIPLSNISKYMSGNLANPSIYNAAAVCIYLGLSLDDAFGLPTNNSDSSAQIAELEKEILKLRTDLDYLRQDKSNIEKTLRGKKMIISVLLAVIILLITVFGFGIIYDSTIRDAGFILGNTIAPISIVCITSIIIAIIIAIIIIGRYLYK